MKSAMKQPVKDIDVLPEHALWPWISVLSSGSWASVQRRPALSWTVSHVLGLAHNGFLMGVIVSFDWEIRQRQFVKIIVY